MRPLAKAETGEVFTRRMNDPYFGGALAFGALIYTLGAKYLPMFTQEDGTVTIIRKRI